MFGAVVFDMYETLISVFSDGMPYYSAAMAKDAGVTKEAYRQYWHAFENDRTLGRLDLREAVGGTLEQLGVYTEELTELITGKRLADQKRIFEGARPEIISMLEALRERGIRTGLISNCYFEERDCIRASVLAPYFDVMMLSCELGIRKPEPEIFRMCADRLGLRTDEILYVGDGGSDELEAAAACGMVPVQACWFLPEDDPDIPDRRKEGFPHAETPETIVRTAAGETENKE